MALATRNPFNLLSEFNKRMENALSEEEESNGSLSRWSPRVDVYEEGDDIVFEVEAAGFDKNNLDVSLENNQLTISGERDKRHEESDRDYYRSERLQGVLKRTFSLSNDVDQTDIGAEYDDGILTVRVPKVEEAQKKQIEIS